MDSYIWAHIISTTVIIIALFLQKYFSRKAENLADKEDIEELTEKVESIRSKFDADVEKLKSELGISSQLKLTFINEEINAIINAHNSLSNWAINLYDLSTQDFYTIERINDIMLDTSDKLKLANMSLSKLELYCDDYELISVLYDFRNLVKTKISGITIRFLLKYKSILFQGDYIKEKMSDYDLYKSKSDEGIELYDNYLNELSKHTSDIAESKRNYIIKIKGRLKEIYR